jgi:hypothetical protein
MPFILINRRNSDQLTSVVISNHHHHHHQEKKNLYCPLHHCKLQLVELQLQITIGVPSSSHLSLPLEANSELKTYNKLHTKLSSRLTLFSDAGHQHFREPYCLHLHPDNQDLNLHHCENLNSCNKLCTFSPSTEISRHFSDTLILNTGCICLKMITFKSVFISKLITCIYFIGVWTSTIDQTSHHNRIQKNLLRTNCLHFLLL